MLKRFSCVAVLVAAFSAPSLADRYAEGDIVPVTTWSGMFVGLNAGGAWDRASHSLAPTGNFLSPPFDTFNPLRTRGGDLNDGAFIGGVQAGINYQAGSLVIGLEGDVSKVSLNSSDAAVGNLAAPLVGTMAYDIDQRLSWLATLRARLGYAASGGLLIYATGGLAIGRIESSTFVQFSSAGDTYTGSLSDTRAGWAFGGGFERAINRNWSLKADILWIDLGSARYVSPERTGFPGFSYTTRTEFQEVVARIGINYKFGQ